MSTILRDGGNGAKTDIAEVSEPQDMPVQVAG